MIPKRNPGKEQKDQRHYPSSKTQGKGSNAEKSLQGNQRTDIGREV